MLGNSSNLSSNFRRMLRVTTSWLYHTQLMYCKEINITNSEWLLANNSFKSDLIYKLTSRGFFSEINSMINSILYCLLNQKRFFLDLSESNAISPNAWNDYFKSDLSIIDYKNLTQAVDDQEVSHGLGNDVFSRIQSQISSLEKITLVGWKQPRLKIQEIEFEGNIFELKRALARMIWFLEETLYIKSQNVLKELNMNGEFAVFHIRKGDKVKGYLSDNGDIIIEADDISCLRYYKRLKRINNKILNVFVMSDDFSTIQYLKENTPLKIHHLCPESQMGYEQVLFDQMSDSFRTAEVQRLIIETEIASKSNYFIGSHASNVSKFISLIHHSPSQCFNLV